MAIVNTGKAFFTQITITKEVNGAQTLITESVLAPFGMFDLITQADFAMLSEAAAQERYDAFKSYLNNKYLGLDLDSVLTNDPINENLTMCPI
jgi:hypothetical protein